MIVLVGIASESPMELVADALRDLDAPFVFVHQRRWREWNLSLEVSGGAVHGALRCGSMALDLDDVRAVYTRQMDDQALPDVQVLPADHPDRALCRSLHEGLGEWTSLTSARVVNRPSAQASNGSKPYQAQIIREHGFAIPETVITNDPDVVRAFRAEHGRIIFKSASGVRSIVRELTDDDDARLDAIRWCPVQFQAYVPGVDVRVHAIGGSVFATRIDSDATDYRYAVDQTGTGAELVADELDGDIAARCLALTAALGLELSGIDLRLSPDGRAYCFEVNPSPGFSYYEDHTGQPIAMAIAEHLRAA